MASVNIPLPPSIQQGLNAVNNLAAQLQPQTVYDTPASQVQAPDATELPQLTPAPELTQATGADVEEAEAPTQATPAEPGPQPFGTAQDVYVAPMSTRGQRFKHAFLCLPCCRPRH